MVRCLLSAVLMLSVGCLTASGREGEEVRVVAGCANMEPVTNWHVLTENWLRRKLHPDGYWRYDDRNGMVDAGNESDRVLATSLSVLCYLSSGTTPTEGHGKAGVRQALIYLMQEVQLDRLEPPTAPRCNGLTLATTALVFSELSAMTGKEEWSAAAQRLLARLAMMQNYTDGGFPCFIGEAGDLRTTVWAAMAFCSADLQAIGSPAGWKANVLRYLDKQRAEDGDAYRFANEAPSTCATAMSLYGRLLAGTSRDDRDIAKIISTVEQLDPLTNDCETVFFRQQAIAVGQYPTRSPLLIETAKRLIARQDTNTVEPGSWFRGDDRYSKSHGRLYQTQLTILTASTYYGHLPLVRTLHKTSQPEP